MKQIRTAQKINTVLLDIITGRFLYARRSNADDAAAAIEKQTEQQKEAFENLERIMTQMANRGKAP